MPLLFALAIAYNVGQQAQLVVASPFMTEHALPARRNALFALQFAVSSGTQVVAALGGGALAAVVAAVSGQGPDSPTAYRVLLLAMAALTVLGLVTAALLTDDRGLVRGIDVPRHRPNRGLPAWRPAPCTRAWTGSGCASAIRGYSSG